MNSQTVTLSRANPLVKRLLAVTFPHYTGRKLKAVVWNKPLYLQLFWDEGSRDQVVLIDWGHGQIGHLTCPSPWAKGACDPLEVPSEAILAVHSIFMGKDTGVTFYVREEIPQVMAEITDGL
jgi:hypothetical protein